MLIQNISDSLVVFKKAKNSENTRTLKIMEIELNDLRRSRFQTRNRAYRDDEAVKKHICNANQKWLDDRTVIFIQLIHLNYYFESLRIDYELGIVIGIGLNLDPESVTSRPYTLRQTYVIRYHIRSFRKVN